MHHTSLTSPACLALFALMSLAALIHLVLREDGSAWRKGLWSIAILAPFLGPLFYLTLYRVPTKKPDHEIPETGHQY